jgi:sensor histidine kinase YesM
VFGPDGALPHEGIGISNTRERLARLFGDSGMLALRNRPGGGAEALVRLPLVRGGAVVEPVGAPA